MTAHAVATVPFYREVASELNLGRTPSLLDMPLLTKAQVASAGPEAMTSASAEASSLRVVRTGGTTGAPADFLRDSGDPEREGRSLETAWNRFGVSRADRIAVIVGRPVGTDGEQKKVPSSGHLWLGGERLSDDVLGRHYEALAEYEPAFLRGYPSALVRLAEFMLGRGLSAPTTLRATGSSSEVLLPAHRDLLARAFSVPHADLYGMTEHVALACSCPQAEALHVDQDYGYVELVDDSGALIDRLGVEGEIVATGLGNEAAPLIRYRTGDRASWVSPECGCGVVSPRLNPVAGRVRDQVVARDGTVLPFGPYFYGGVLKVGGVREVQFRHVAPGALILDVVRDPSYSSVLDDVRRAVSDISGFTVEVRDVHGLERTGVGKLPLLLSQPSVGMSGNS